MKQRKRLWSICLAIALVVSSIYGWNAPAQAIYADSKVKKEQIVVYVAAQGKSSDGTKTVSIGKTPMQVEEGTMASAVVENVLDNSGYGYDMPDTGYGPYLEAINGMGTEQDGDNWYYWSFYVNGNYSSVGLGSYELRDGDQISLIYTYDDWSTEAAAFADDTTLNPETPAVESADAAMKEAQAIAAKDVYDLYFSDGHIPGLGNDDELYVVFSLARAGYEAPEFYGKVKAKLTRQLTELAAKGTTYDAAVKKDVTEETFASKMAPEEYMAKIVLAMTALGMDARTTGGYDLIDKMAQKKTYEEYTEYSREPMMLLAFDCGNYKLPEGNDYCTREELAAKVVENIDNDIAEALDGGINTAAMAVQPLAPYTESASVEKTVNKVIRFAGNMQDAKGYFGNSEMENNPWSLSQALIMLGELGIHPLRETQNIDFVKNGHTLADAALEFVDFENKCILKDKVNFQPEQLLCGITSYNDTVNGTEKLYSIKTVPTATEPTAPFEEEKAQTGATPTAAPTTTPSTVPATTPSMAPSTSEASKTLIQQNKTASKKNAAKKIAATKKKINVKKGKTATIVVKVTATNSKKATTDSVKVSAKKIKVKKIIKKAGKITIKVKTLKKGKQIVKIKVGKASTKVTLNVR